MTPIRAFGHGSVRRPARPATAALMLIGAAWLAMQLPMGAAASGQQASPPAGQQASRPAGQQGTQQQPPQRPVFRVGANAVRVDVFATKNGVPVEDLTADDFEVQEDRVAQKVDAFEHIKIVGGGMPTNRVEPRNAEESNQMASDPRARLFVLFLDSYHVHQEASYNVTKPLVNLLNRVIGDEDLIAVMTPEMSARDISFTRRTDNIAQMLSSYRWWGQRGREGSSEDPREQQYMDCYPPDLSTGRVTSVTAQAMIDRKREKDTLEALQDLVRHLDGIREERKAILLVSEGWQLFRPDPTQLGGNQQGQTGLGIGPNGRIGPVGQNPGGYTRIGCDQDRTMLAGIDDERLFRDIMNEANRANASFYPIEPRGLAVFDNDIGPNPPPPPSQDFAMLEARHDTLLTIADNTDGVAVINSNNIDAGLKRVVSDLSSYYLLGYTSTNSKLDGKFRAISVRVKRPGVEVRARRGYNAPTEEEARMRTTGAAPAIVDPATAAVTSNIATLEGSARDVPLRLSVSAGWWTPSGDPAKPTLSAAEPALWILGEVNTKPATGEDWSQGGEADVAITAKDGSAVVRYTVPIAPGTGRFLSRFPRSIEDVWLDPGSYAVRVRVKPTTGGLPITDTTRFDVAAPQAASKMLLGQPLYFRRGPTTGPVELVTSDRRYRRTDRIIVQVSTTLAPERVSAELLDRTGKPIAIPVNAVTVEKESVRWVRSDLALAPLAAGDYVIRITTERGTEKIQMLAAFRIVP